MLPLIETNGTRKVNTQRERRGIGEDGVLSRPLLEAKGSRGANNLGTERPTPEMCVLCSVSFIIRYRKWGT